MILPINGSAAIVVLRSLMFGPVDIDKGAAVARRRHAGARELRTGSIGKKRPIREMRLCATEVPSQ